ncbi:hypothetical protein JZ751_020553 [Albula glossodonta]|uniref:Uncharacterized protein n=1 Tax=Albula glossodonta TaxID=121402 RepID=A0A8T2PIX2_9TELE|nr:hypothetical protein JZ751_020553 [Albula glossodonta]
MSLKDMPLFWTALRRLCFCQQFLKNWVPQRINEEGINDRKSEEIPETVAVKSEFPQERSAPLCFKGDLSLKVA